jgi:hypothetical protein
LEAKVFAKIGKLDIFKANFQSKTVQKTPSKAKTLFSLKEPETTEKRGASPYPKRIRQEKPQFTQLLGVLWWYPLWTYP